MGLLDRFAGSPRRRFAQLALRVARRTPGVERAVYQPDDFAIAIHRTGVAGPAHLYLSNVFRETADASPAERRQQLERLIRLIAPLPEEDWDAVRAKLRPVLRPVTFGAAGPTGMRPPLSRPAMPHLRELVVIDTPEAMAYVSPDRLETWGVPVDEVFAVARQNLAVIARGALDRPWRDSTAISILDDGDGYFTSLLLSPGWLSEVGERMGGPALAFVPDSNTLLVTPLPDTGAEQIYAAVEHSFGEAVRYLSPVGYVAGPDGRSVPYAPPPGHPHHRPARRADAVLALTEYSNQTEWLSDQYAKAGVDVHVGSLIAVEPSGGGPVETIATWTDGVCTLLPRADSVAFARAGDGIDFRVPWRIAEQEAGLCPEPLLAPARYRVETWPSADVLDGMRQHRLD
ncbi:hypothetical protein GCM10010112_47470 [Actinoplanes lobatus]|uniref:DUF1444 family protein n=1 Tax=Actinoplanes lobatus TaxID=113568 RepID=A0A7W7MGW5_9ACTN|nr:hypothetical protein [Actinoplanes lobatus]MBB4749701.1 hypothetical protein [Actinoplanes lobatus]GGN75841.1 hypothetical protein GCM10010112_47470 [Actinoplanes lobatus]GIE38439.1 hypothetical protein Alo02nite_13370 [Actinoplanes lobatus]